MTATNDVFSNVYICAWVARWDCGVHGLLCCASKLYAQSAAAKSVAASFVRRMIDKVDGYIYYMRGPHQQFHRTDGPAVEGADGSKWWWVNDSLHRTDGPAVERADGTKKWWVHGKQHRTDGPAVKWSDGSEEWWENDVRQP